MLDLKDLIFYQVIFYLREYKSPLCSNCYVRAILEYIANRHHFRVNALQSYAADHEVKWVSLSRHRLSLVQKYFGCFVPTDVSVYPVPQINILSDDTAYSIFSTFLMRRQREVCTCPSLLLHFADESSFARCQYRRFSISYFPLHEVTLNK